MLRALTLTLTLLITTSICYADQAESDQVDSVSVDSSLNVSRWFWGAGVQTSSYKYEEPGLMELRGRLYRFSGYLSRQINNLHLTTELTIGFGLVDYYGGLMDDSGKVTPYEDTDIRDNLYEFRFLIGQSFQQGSFQMIPAVGYGVRKLDDLPGSRPFGYDRHSTYTYLPIRIQFIRPLSNNPHPARLSATFEYDHFLGGTQETDLSDANFSYISGDTLGVEYEDIVSDQNSGTGFRFNLTWDLSSQPGRINTQISIYYESWRIDKSKLTPFNRTIVMVDPADNIVDRFVAIEPENRTREIGVTFRITRF